MVWPQPSIAEDGVKPSKGIVVLKRVVYRTASFADFLVV